MKCFPVALEDESVKSEQLQEAQSTILEKKGTDTSDVQLVRWEEGDSLQVLHIRAPTTKSELSTNSFRVGRC